VSASVRRAAQCHCAPVNSDVSPHHESPAACTLVLTGIATAQTREGWMRSCVEGGDEPPSVAYRLCAGKYLDELQATQLGLLKNVQAKIAATSEEEVKPEPARRHLEASQRHWAEYVAEHCAIAEDMFGAGNASGDVYPSCMTGEYELRNAQLRRMLAGDYER
jgi:uncharacterized protein YecT (DUF1311 family)